MGSLKTLLHDNPDDYVMVAYAIKEQDRILTEDEIDEAMEALNRLRYKADRWAEYESTPKESVPEPTPSVQYPVRHATCKAYKPDECHREPCADCDLNAINEVNNKADR